MKNRLGQSYYHYRIEHTDECRHDVTHEVIVKRRSLVYAANMITAYYQEEYQVDVVINSVVMINDNLMVFDAEGVE